MNDYIINIVNCVNNDDYKTAKRYLKQLERFTDRYTINILLLDYLKASQVFKLFNC